MSLGPEVTVPFPGMVNPDLDAARQRHFTWARAMALFSGPQAEARYQIADIPDLMARFYPTASREDLDLVTNFLGWSFIWDDYFDRPADKQWRPGQVTTWMSAYEDVINGGPLRMTNPLLDAFAQVWPQVLTRGSAAWQARLTEHMLEALAGFTAEAERHARHLPLTAEEYADLRLPVSGCAIGFDLIEVAECRELPPHAHQWPDLLTLRRQAAVLICLHNDAASVDREQAAGGSNNIVLILEQSLGRVSALQRTRELTNDATTAYLKLERSLQASDDYQNQPPDVRRDIDAFVQGLRYFVRGSLDWHRESGRYKP